jgi:hypothetical protein
MGSCILHTEQRSQPRPVKAGTSPFSSCHTTTHRRGGAMSVVRIVEAGDEMKCAIAALLTHD